jgi:hypothetical protein
MNCSGFEKDDEDTEDELVDDVSRTATSDIGFSMQRNVGGEAKSLDTNGYLSEVCMRVGSVQTGAAELNK